MLLTHDMDVTDHRERLSIIIRSHKRNIA